MSFGCLCIDWSLPLPWFLRNPSGFVDDLIGSIGWCCINAAWSGWWHICLLGCKMFCSIQTVYNFHCCTAHAWGPVAGVWSCLPIDLSVLACCVASSWRPVSWCCWWTQHCCLSTYLLCWGLPFLSFCSWVLILVSVSFQSNCWSPSVRPSMYLISATPPKPLIGFLWNFTHL